MLGHMHLHEFISVDALDATQRLSLSSAATECVTVLTVLQNCESVNEVTLSLIHYLYIPRFRNVSIMCHLR